MTDLRILHSSQDRYDMLVHEFQLLLSCYQNASQEDKRAVWNILTKYMVLSDE